MREQRLLIGLIGPIAAGKGEVAKYLEKDGFSTFTLSDQVREEARRRGISEPTRKDLQNLGNELRKTFGEEILARRALVEIEQGGVLLAVIGGIRNPAEVCYLKHQGRFFLVGVTAPQRIRFERTHGRSRSNNSRTWEEFLDADSRDLGAGAVNHKQNVQACLALADFTIDNHGSKGELYEQVALILAEIQKLSQEERRYKCTPPSKSKKGCEPLKQKTTKRE